MRLTKQVYIASAYSYRGLSKNPRVKAFREEERFEAVTKCIGRLHDKYPYAFIGPITQSHLTAPHTTTKSGGFEHWKRIDFTFIANSEEVWILADAEGAWKESIGVTEEIEFAISQNKVIRFIHPETYQVKKMTFKEKVSV